MKDLNIKFCKYVLAAEKKSTNIAIISELGRNPLYFWILSAESSLLYNASKENIIISLSNVNCWYKSVVFFSQKINSTGQRIPSGRNKTRLLCNQNCVKDKCHVLLIVQYIKKKEIFIRSQKQKPYVIKKDRKTKYNLSGWYPKKTEQ